MQATCAQNDTVLGALFFAFTLLDLIFQDFVPQNKDRGLTKEDSLQ